MTRAALAVSMGDPAGIGLEIAVRAWAERRDRPTPPFCLFADPAALMRTADRLGISATLLETDDFIAAQEGFSNAIPIVPIPLAAIERPGQPDPANAAAILGAIEAAVCASATAPSGALVTLPIAKAPLYAAGFMYPGHTEFLAALTNDMRLDGPRGPMMMLAGASLKVALVTIHIPLVRVSAALSVPRIVEAGTLLAHALQHDFGIASPRLAVAGINPHAGESGEIGREDMDIVAPAVEALRSAGIDARGPLPADAMFHADARASYDAALAMYHDQGLIPLKTLHFWDAVNVTLGLPIVRTSPDHGVAYDIAGRGVARADSFRAALKLATDIATRRCGS